MKQKLLIFLVLIFLVLLLAGLNAATYVQKEKVADTEFAPNRSTYNSGSTGTQAFYALLSETGRNVTRWQASLETLSSDPKRSPAVFVMIGPLRKDLSDDEQTKLMEWVSAGGTLIVIDREPASDLIATTAEWNLSVAPEVIPELYTVDAANPKQMTADRAALKPSLPSSFARGVNAVQPSRFASSVKLEASVYETKSVSGDFAGPVNTPTATPYDLYSSSSEPTPPPPVATPSESESSSNADKNESEDNLELSEASASFAAPVVHLGAGGRNLLVEAPFSEGRIIILTDPFIVANNGISMVDNSQLAVNLVTSRDGLIAFDEFHHGYGANNNRLFQYFEGTPVVSIFAQCALLIALVFVSQSRRFARPIPEPEPSRLSKLEYVSAMAELQQRTSAYDLAVENIYSDFRRRASSLVGLDNTTATRRELASRIAERTRDDARSVEQLLFECEDVIHGEPVDRRTTISLIGRLRDLEAKLGLKRAARKGL
ncbi:MAG: hypothetical protein DMF63_18145 [Acidobacteria bacterium]|nr:MAG: hypothetical protein DMF63_18145 [Acidobacteriota bacterium]